jgi:hypothetical protein
MKVIFYLIKKEAQSSFVQKKGGQVAEYLSASEICIYSLINESQRQFCDTLYD